MQVPADPSSSTQTAGSFGHKMDIYRAAVPNPLGPCPPAAIPSTLSAREPVYIFRRTPFASAIGTLPAILVRSRDPGGHPHISAGAVCSSH